MTLSVPTVPLSCDISVLEFQSALFRPRGKQNHFCIVRNILHAQWLLIVFGCAANLKAWREYHSVSSQARANIYGMLNFIQSFQSVFPYCKLFWRRMSYLLELSCKDLFGDNFILISSQSHSSLWFWKALARFVCNMY